ncbi:MAG: hypothetical protein ACOY7T_05890 [Pseudomonadota bacterium]
MSLWTIVEAPLLGELGEKSRLGSREPCSGCGIMPPLEVEFLDYSLDYWDGQPLLFLAQQYVVTPELRAAIEQAGLTGMEFARMRAELNEDFVDPDQPSLSLPQFSHMKVLARLSAGPGWWDPAGQCDVCGLALWRDNPYSFMAPNAAASNPQIPRRSVYRRTYGGQDIFNLDDRGPVVVSQRFRDLLDAQGVSGLTYQAVDLLD